MTQDDRMETITDPAEIRATSDERGCCDCRTFDQHERECILPDERTTPAPVGAAVALDLDAIEAAAFVDDGWWSVPVLALVAEVRRLTAEAATQREWFEAADAAADRRLDQSIAWMDRAEAAEAEVVTLRAKVADLSAALTDIAQHGTRHDLHPTHRAGDEAFWHRYIDRMDESVRRVAGAALATTWEGE